MVLLTGCAGNTVPLVADAKLCEAWSELQVCPQDKFTDQTAKRILGLNEGRKAGFSCPPAKTKPDCPPQAPPAKVAASDVKTSQRP